MKRLPVSGGTLVDNTVLGGVGTLGIGNGATVQLDGNVADTVTIAFDGAGLLGIGASDAFAGVIAGLGASDTIDLQSFGYATATGLSWDQTASGQGVLTLLNGTQIVTLTLAGSFTSADFYQFEDAAGGTAIIDIAAASAMVGRDPAGAQTRGQIAGAADRGAAGSGPAAPHPGPDWHGVWLHADHA